MSTNYNDPCSFSNPQLFVIKHIKIDWRVTFESKQFIGSCDIDFELNSSSASQNDFIVRNINRP